MEAWQGVPGLGTDTHGCVPLCPSLHPTDQATVCDQST